MRIVGAVFVAAHGLGHIIWFMSTWARWSLGESGRAELAKHEGGFLVESSSITGKLIGVLALMALLGFITAAWGIWTQTSWWPSLLLSSAVPSVVVLLAMWNPVGSVSFNAFLANALLGAATLIPWGDRFLGAH